MNYHIFIPTVYFSIDLFRNVVHRLILKIKVLLNEQIIVLFVEIKGDRFQRLVTRG